MKSRTNQILGGLILVFGILLVGIHFWHGQNRIADPDEFQTIINAFDASRGLIPYKHFWDNHGPLNITLLKPLLLFYNTDHALIHWLRTLAWVTTLLIVALIYLTWNIFHPRQSPIVAILFILASPPFLAKALEIRPDILANLLATMALSLLAYGTVRQKTLPFCLAGVCVGLIAGITLKFALVAISLSIYIVTLYICRRQWPRMRDLAAAIATSTATIGVLLATYYTPEFWLCYFEANSTRAFSGFTSSDFLNIYKKAPFWSLLATAAIILAGYRAIRKMSLPHETALLMMVLFYLIQYFLFLPTKNMQSLLPVYAPLALLAGSVLPKTWTTISQRLSLPFPVSAFLLILSIGLLLRDLHDYNQLANRQLPRQVAFANTVLKQTSAENEIFDPGGVVFLKPKPGQFHVLVTFLRDLHLSEKIDLGIIPLLENHDIQTIIFDARTQDLRLTEVTHMRNRYTPVLAGPDCLMLRRNDLVTDAPTNLPGKTFRRWQLNEFSGGTIPDSTANPDWFHRYQQVMNP